MCLFGGDFKLGYFTFYFNGVGALQSSAEGE